MIAVCGPGRQLLTALILLLDGTEVTRVEESPNLPDPGWILLIDEEYQIPLPPFQFQDPA